MTVARLRREMSAQELAGWVELEKVRKVEREQAERKARRR
jgi:hypothetical protein